MAKIDIDSALDDGRLTLLRDAYAQGGRDVMTGILSAGIPGVDPDTAGYIQSIRSKFYAGSAAGGGGGMTDADRERCLIAVLASREGGFNLALHVYIALMSGLTQHDVADVIFLVGVYAGVDRMSDGFATVMKTLCTLADVASPPGAYGAEQVFDALKTAFGR